MKSAFSAVSPSAVWSCTSITMWSVACGVCVVCGCDMSDVIESNYNVRPGHLVIALDLLSSVPLQVQAPPRR